MNQKTAKLLRKYAKANPDHNLNALKREWNDMNQFERRDARVRMISELEAAPAAPAETEDAADPA
ncbi:MAG: hypothetical protein AAFU79_34095 [Myxococcota bacterium]